MTTFEIGSMTAKGGFANEREICKKFNNWKKDNEAQAWLRIMGYDINSINSLEAILNFNPNQIEKNRCGKIRTERKF